MKFNEDVPAEKLRSAILKLLETGEKSGREIAREFGLDDSYSKVNYNLKQLEASKKIKRTDKNNRLSPYVLNTSAPKPRTDDIPDAPVKRQYNRRNGKGAKNGRGSETLSIRQYLIRDIKNKLAELEALD